MPATTTHPLAVATHARRATPGPVLVGTDGRAPADGAVRIAALTARRLGAAVQAIAIVEPLATYGAELLVALPPEFEGERRAHVRDAVRRQLRAVAGPDGDGWPIAVEGGAPAGTLAALAGERQAALLVLGIGRHAPVDRLFGTETALRALRQTDRPLLAVPPDATALPARAIAGIDFTPASVHAAEVALELLAPGGTLVLTHVQPAVNAAQPLLAEWAQAYARRVDELFGRLQVLLGERRGDVAVRTRVVVGEPADALLAVAAEEGAALVASGTHGAGLVERLLVGSVATALLRRATTMVLACQEPDAVEVARIERRLLGTAESTEPTGWAALLADFSRRNAGRPARLEIDDPALGARVEARGLALLGAAWDRRDARVELMLGDPVERRRHVTRSVPEVTAIVVTADAAGRDVALRVEHGRGLTLLGFEDAPG